MIKVKMISSGNDGKEILERDFLITEETDHELLADSMMDFVTASKAIEAEKDTGVFEDKTTVEEEMDDDADDSEPYEQYDDKGNYN